ncbi:MAG: hypothetical protein JWQ63_1418 [Mucilaginibacter sp.]|nr:hypothetical protein [Mucilaginibacter sp.]
MAKRFKIGIKFFFDNNSNSGIVNYIYNIISALKTLDDGEKPAIIIFYSFNSPIDYLKQIEYPYIKYILFRPTPSNYFLMKANGLIRRLFKKDVYKQLKYFNKIDCLYPYFEFMDGEFVNAKNKIHWLVDFNNKAFPAHYNDNGQAMNEFQDKITALNECVVLSSNTLFDELKSYYPNFNCKVKILRFASALPKLEKEEVDLVKLNYNLKLPYFMSPNQFWEHKNQIIVLEALNIIKKEHPELKFNILFSGSLEVSRGKGLYIEQLKNKVIDFGLDKYISFLGVVDRKDQLLLMKGSVALLQPSLYEGWSTLVEEAKALNKFIILSDLPVHREQISSNVAFFNPVDAVELAGKIVEQLTGPFSTEFIDYSYNIKKFGKDVIDALL